MKGAGEQESKWNVSCDITEAWHLEKPRTEGVASMPGSDARGGQEAARCRSHVAPKGAGDTGQASPQMAPGTHSSRPKRVTGLMGQHSRQQGRVGPGSPCSLVLLPH